MPGETSIITHDLPCHAYTTGSGLVSNLHVPFGRVQLFKPCGLSCLTAAFATISTSICKSINLCLSFQVSSHLK